MQDGNEERLVVVSQGDGEQERETENKGEEQPFVGVWERDGEYDEGKEGAEAKADAARDEEMLKEFVNEVEVGCMKGFGKEVEEGAHGIELCSHPAFALVAEVCAVLNFLVVHREVFEVQNAVVLTKEAFFNLLVFTSC